MRNYPENINIKDKANPWNQPCAEWEPCPECKGAGEQEYSGVLDKCENCYGEGIVEVEIEEPEKEYDLEDFV